MEEALPRSHSVDTSVMVLIPDGAIEGQYAVEADMTDEVRVHELHEVPIEHKVVAYISFEVSSKTLPWSGFTLRSPVDFVQMVSFRNFSRRVLIQGGHGDATGTGGQEQRDSQALALLSLSPVAASALPKVVCGIAGSAPQQDKVELSLQQGTRKAGQVTSGGQPCDLLAGGLLQGATSDDAHRLVQAGQEAEGMGDHHDVTEVTHAGHAGTSLLVGDIQDFIAGLQQQVQPLL